MHYTIYKTTNLLDGKFYIGKHQTKNLDDGYLGSGKLLKHAIKKYGIENFKKEILETFSTEAEMNAAEKRLVILGEMSYNLCPGGEGGWGYVNTLPQSAETLRKKREAGIKGKEFGYLGALARGPMSEEHKAAVRKACIGRVPSDEERRKMSERAKARWAKV